MVRDKNGDAHNDHKEFNLLRFNGLTHVLLQQFNPKTSDQVCFVFVFWLLICGEMVVQVKSLMQIYNF